MLNGRNLTELLSQNSDERLCKRWYLVTTNATLLANNQPTDVRELRREAAMVVLTWQEHQSGREAEVSERRAEYAAVDGADGLHALTIETEDANIFARKVQRQLLLVLTGGVPPRRPGFEAKVTAEGPDEEPYPAEESATAGTNTGTSVSSKAQSTTSTAAISVLRLQRKKFDAMAAAIVHEFERTGFQMPEARATRFL